jgi:hypothetical protein
MQTNSSALEHNPFSYRRKFTTREQIALYFHMPISLASKELGICCTLLKKMCREFGIPRWPFRKIRGIEKDMIDIITLLSSTYSINLVTQLIKLQRKREKLVHGFATTSSKSVPPGFTRKNLVKFFNLESQFSTATLDRVNDESISNSSKVVTKSLNQAFSPKDSKRIHFDSQAPTENLQSVHQQTLWRFSDAHSSNAYVCHESTVSERSATLPPTILPFDVYSSVSLRNSNLNIEACDCCRTAFKSPSKMYSCEYETELPFPSWYEKERLEAIRIQRKHHLV